ncbi:MAG TPA: hypothetical protein VHS31_04900 [Tepidisphaeraceae bacterium]|jgi:hypothetical protein|nr:hypothetical protein [Tepidisphaeraceae bacterium]
MAIQVQCTTCGKVYTADESLAGRRMRCRECGNTFTIPALNAPPEEPENDLSGLAGPEEEASSSESTYAGHYPGNSPESDSDSSQSFVSTGRYRPRFNYPYAVVVDRWLPILLSIGGLAWVIIAAIRYDETNRPGLIVSRILVLILAYLIVIFPMAAKGIQMASRDLGFQLPRAKYSKTLFSFMPAFALGSVLWMAGGTTGLILGLIVGLIASCLAMWLLFHLHPAELPAATGYAGGMMVFGIVIVGAALFGMNLLLSSALVSMHKMDSFPGSPFGMAFTWPKPVEPAPIPRKPQIASTPPAPQPPAPEPTPISPTTQSVVVQAPPAPTPPSDSTNPTTQNSGGMFADATNNDTTPPPTPAPEITHQAAVTAPTTASPLVDSIAMEPIQNQFDEIVRPSTPSSWAAVLHKGNNGQGQIDRVWIGPGNPPLGVKPWLPAGSTPFVSDPKVGDRFALSPDGDLLAYLTSFPSLSVHLFSFEKKTQQNIKLNESFGVAEVLGFVNSSRLLVRREKDGRVGCELIDTNGDTIHDISTQKFNCNSVTSAISPDGTTLAVASLDTQHPPAVPAIFLYELPSGASRKLPVADLAGSPVTTPTALAFSPDGTRIAALYEQSPNGLLVIFRTKNATKPLISLPLNPVPAQPDRDFTGSSIIWVGDDSLCLYGKSIVSSSTGALVGDLGIPNVISQRFTKPNLLELNLAASSGDHQIAMVKLKMDQIQHP